MPQIRKGNRIPNATLYEAQPENRINILDLVGNKKAIIFGVPGAYVPGCSRVHLRGFIEKSTDLRFLGFQEIICVSVNDPFVLSAWGNAKGANDKVRMLADPMASYTKAIGMDTDIPELGGIRSRRYSMAIVNGVVKELFIDAPNVKLVCLHSDGVPTYCT
ncbi:peroxiredoxin-5, mitochondrial-like [Osmia lignaria lignaria]|uniref:peroxiredoxin-5, mitochondrial-like n=1 Tax=Osmia lignaria lignaria TaxID=1437193 RepID=UPI00147864B8|nr:peroxiredoxin-5, mitochondrial-like [Osmia lignaria]